MADSQIRADQRQRFAKEGYSASGNFGRRVRRYGIERYLDFDVVLILCRELRAGIGLRRWQDKNSPRVRAAILAAREAMDELVTALIEDWNKDR